MKKFYTMALGVCALSLSNAQVSDIGSYVQVTDISNNGVAVGNIFGSAIFMWSEANSGAVIAEGGEFGVSGNANISEDGSLISMSLPNPSNGDQDEAVVYTVANQSFNYLGDLGFSTGMDTSSAWGMSSNGQHVVGFAWTSASKGEAVLWKAGAPILGLGSTVSTRSSRANDVNADASIVAGWQDADNGLRQGVLWRNGVQEFLKDNDGVTLGEAAAISADGKTVCGTTNLTGLGYVWNETDGTTYITSDNPDYITYTTTMSADGKTVLGFSFDPSQSLLLGEAFIWTKEGGRVNLNEYVASLGFDDLGITFAVPTGISPDGKFLGGIGADFELGDARGFVVRLPGALATQDAVVSDKLSVYPNPVKDFTTLKTSNKIETAEVYNLAGQLVFSSKVNGDKKINLSNLKPGIYILKVKTDKGIETVKLMKN